MKNRFGEEIEERKESVGPYVQTEYVHRNACDYCFDTGILFTKEETLPTLVLMRCACSAGVSSLDVGLPQWNYKIGAVYRRQTFPAKDFKPLETDGDIGKSIEILAQEWNAKKKFSEEFWKYQIENSGGK